MNQGTLEWHLERLGAVTASNFQRVLGSCAARNSYYMELMEARRAIAGGLDKATAYVEAKAFETAATAWGTAHEDQARAAYELKYDRDIEQVGFIRHPDDYWIGCSLDGRNHEITIEIKCPYKLENHIKTVRGGMPTAHIAQVQGGLWIADRAACDFISYHPDYKAQPLYVERIVRDERYIAALADKIQSFATALAAGRPLPEDDPAPDTVPTLF
jgi:putative phage-type endonuclease